MGLVVPITALWEAQLDKYASAVQRPPWRWLCQVISSDFGCFVRFLMILVSFMLSLGPYI